MRKINKLDVLRLVLVLALVAGIGLAFGSVGRFVPTHKIVQSVYCGSCHPEEVQELSATTHLGKFSEEIHSMTMSADNGKGGNATPSAYTNARVISGACMMCHNYWENFKWYGVKNFALTPYDSDIPSIGALPQGTDIYGNPVSPYGLGSTQQWAMNISGIKGTGNGSGIYKGTATLSAEPWKLGLDNYSYTDASGNHTRLDYVWSRLSSVSPGPVGFQLYDPISGNSSSCGGGTVEHRMCHIAASAVALAFTDQKYEVSDYPDSNSTTTGSKGQFAGKGGKGIFFTHEMAFTTAQYAAKPVKICGACHVMKLPPMQWGGEPWAVVDVNSANDNGGVVQDVTDPFGFRPTYNNLVGTAGDGMVKEELTSESTGKTPGTTNLPVAFRTPDWAHSNVPCIRCHAHAGVNGDTVSSNSE